MSRCCAGPLPSRWRCARCGRGLCLVHTQENLTCALGCVSMARVREVLLAARELLVPGWSEGLTLCDDGAVLTYDPELGLSVETALERAGANFDERDWAEQVAEAMANAFEQEKPRKPEEPKPSTVDWREWLKTAGRTHAEVMQVMARAAHRALALS